DTHTEEGRLDSQFLKQGAAFLLGINPCLNFRTVLNKIDTDRKRQYRRPMLVALDAEMFPVNLGLQYVVNSVQEVVTVSLRVKADQVRSQQTVEQLPLPWTDAERFRVGPGNMPEDRDSGIWQSLLQHARQKSEVVVLNQNHGVLLASYLLY